MSRRVPSPVPALKSVAGGLLRPPSFFHRPKAVRRVAMKTTESWPARRRSPEGLESSLSWDPWG
jgi:hypothetical protein